MCWTARWARDEILHLIKDAADKPAIIGRGVEEELGALIQNILLADIDVATEADAIAVYRMGRNAIGCKLYEINDMRPLRGRPYDWRATVTFRTADGPLDVEPDLEELSDIYDVVERGPDWDALIEIRIVRAWGGGGQLPVEEGKQL